MTVCKYYLQGNCRFGDRCWNEHLDSQASYHYGRDSPAQYRYTDDYYRKYHYHNPRYSPPPSESSFAFSSQRNSSGEHRSSGDPKFGHKGEVNFSFNKALSKVLTKNQFAALGEHPSNSDSQFGHKKEVSFSFNKALTEIATKEHFPTDENPEKANIKNKENNEIEFIKEDIVRWELGKQWPFSCYSPIKTCFPGFEDVSPEELRWQYYNAKDNGTLHVHLQNINEYAEQMKFRRNELKNATPQTIARLKSLQTMAKQQNSISGSVQSTFNSFIFPDNNLAFSNEKMLPKNYDNSSNFKFCFSQIPEQSKSLFQLSQFKPEHSSTTFGNITQMTTTETSIFGSSDNENTSTVFAASSPFVQQEHYDSIADAQNSAGLSNIDDKLLNEKKLGTLPDNTECIYTELKMLKPSEKEQFTSDMKCFVLGKIPTSPPPRELCF